MLPFLVAALLSAPPPIEPSPKPVSNPAHARPYFSWDTVPLAFHGANRTGRSVLSITLSFFPILTCVIIILLSEISFAAVAWIMFHAYAISHLFAWPLCSIIVGFCSNALMIACSFLPSPSPYPPFPCPPSLALSLPHPPSNQKACIMQRRWQRWPSTRW